MLIHDPYTLLLQELNELNNIENEEACRLTLHKTQDYVKRLRLGYDPNFPDQVDYSCPNQRAAYLLAYYPHYIENIYRTLTILPEGVVEQVFHHKKQRACFLGAGPAPEVLGWIAFLRDFSSETEQALAYLLDKHIWYTGLTVATYHLASHYWPSGKLRTFPIQFDFYGHNYNNTIEMALSNSNLVVMQNCLNDQMGHQEEFLNVFQDILQLVTPGSLFLIIDLQYENVKTLMTHIENVVIENNFPLYHQVSDGLIRFRSKIRVPQIIYDDLLTGDDRLIPRKNTNFYLTAFTVKGSEIGATDDIPF